jgi:hypothetical protein
MAQTLLDSRFAGCPADSEPRMAAAGPNEKEMNSVPFLKTPVDVMRQGFAANSLKAEATPAHPVQLIQLQVTMRAEKR